MTAWSTTRRVLVVDDHPVVRLGMRALLLAQPWVEDCFTASGLDTAVDTARARKPDVAVVDLFVGMESGLTICRRLVELNPHLRVVLTSGVGHAADSVYRAAGASGFVSKASSPETIVEAVRHVANDRGEVDTQQSVSLDTILTARQFDVLREIATGASNIEAAERLFMSPHTVKQHTRVIYKKLGARNRAEAVGLAQRIGLIG